MTATLSTLRTDPTKPNLDAWLAYLYHPIWVRRFITGLVPSNGTDATNDLDFTVGVAADLSTDSLMQLGSAMTKQIDAVWAEGTAAGMLDTGAVANTTYHVYLIRNPKSKKVDILASTSASSPTMPAGYSQKRRIFSFYRSAGANVVFTAVEISGGGLEVLISSPTGVTIKSWSGGADDTAISYTWADCPTGIKLGLIFNASLLDVTPAAVSAIRFSALDQADVAPGSGNQSLRLPAIGIAVGDAVSGQFSIRSNTSGAMRFRAQGSTTDHSLLGALDGWIDQRTS